MVMTRDELLDRFRSPQVQKLFRYSVASAVSVVVSVVCLVIFSGLFGWRAIVASSAATAVATVPNYVMNRRWAWGKDGRSHLLKEVVPFWVLAFIGWAFSTFCVNWMESVAKHHHYSHVVKTGTLAVVYVGAFGILWVAKFIIFNKVLFAHHPEDIPEALDGRSGVPL